MRRSWNVKAKIRGFEIRSSVWRPQLASLRSFTANLVRVALEWCEANSDLGLVAKQRLWRAKA